MSPFALPKAILAISREFPSPLSFQKTSLEETEGKDTRVSGCRVISELGMVREVGQTEFDFGDTGKRTSSCSAQKTSLALRKCIFFDLII